ncbi:MAG: DUF3467 domain-containing protein, partial [Chloroflexota bacterium]|nr:DUF3467 domain-containing protein [Chloroflexota bacterium]
QRQLRLEMPNTLNASYANTVIISHTNSEVVFDFVQIMPNDPRARIQNRIVMTPVNAKLFLRALGENISRFEERNGEIKVPPQPPSLADQLFSTIRTTDEDKDNGSE